MGPIRGEVLILLGVAGVAVILSQALFAPPVPSGRSDLRTPTAGVSPSDAATPSAATPSVATPSAESARHTNVAAGYSFLRPGGWEVSESGTVTELVGPDHDVTVSFGLGPAGSLLGSSTAFATLIEARYDHAELVGPARETIAGHPAVFVGGSAVNDAGLTIRILAITLRVEDENYAISIFVSDASDPVRILPVVEDILASFDVA